MIPNHDFSFATYWNTVEDIRRFSTVPENAPRKQWSDALRARDQAVDDFIRTQWRAGRPFGDPARAADVLRWSAHPNVLSSSGDKNVAELVVDAASHSMLADVSDPNGRNTAGAIPRGLPVTDEEYWDAVDLMGEHASKKPDDDREFWVKNEALVHPMARYFYPALSIIEYSGNIENVMQDVDLRDSGAYGVVWDFMHGRRGDVQSVVLAIAAGALAGDVLRRFRVPQWVPNPGKNPQPALVEERLVPSRHALSHHRTFYPIWTSDGRVRLEVIGEGGCPVGTLFLEPPSGRQCDWALRGFDGERVSKLSRRSLRLARILAAADRNTN